MSAPNDVETNPHSKGAPRSPEEIAAWVMQAPVFEGDPAPEQTQSQEHAPDKEQTQTQEQSESARHDSMRADELSSQAGTDDRWADGREPDEAEAAIDEINREFSLVMWGSKAIVMREVPALIDHVRTPVNDRLRIWTLEAFRAFLENRVIATQSFVRDRKSGELIERRVMKSLADVWLSSPRRRTYNGVEFYPDPKNAPHLTHYLNLWRGFCIEPDFTLHLSHGAFLKQGWARRARSYAVFYDHLITNICRGNEILAQWVFGWCAHMIQRPRERVGTAIVLRGREGTGKTKLGEVIGSLFESHYFLVDDPRYLVGQFNAHLASCLLLQVDEGFWAGDKAAEGRLKGLITAKVQMIEAKGIDPIRLENYVRILFTSNEDWVVPVGMDGRRYVVLDIGEGVQRNADYFGAMEEELNKGGRAALLADLLEFDLSLVNLRDVPKTNALLEQKIRSLDPVAGWWFEKLFDGRITRWRSGWVGENDQGGWIAIDTLFNDYVHVAEKIGVKRKSEKTIFGTRLKKLVEAGGEELRVVKRYETIEAADGSEERKRVNAYMMPDLKSCRAAFELACQQRVSWIEDEFKEAAE